MTDLHKGYVVVLDEDIPEDEAKAIIQAIQMIRGVVVVKPVLADALDDEIIKTRVELEIRRSILNVFKERTES